MKIKLKYLATIFIILSVLLTISAASAEDVNLTDDVEIVDEINQEITNVDNLDEGSDILGSDESNSAVENESESTASENETVEVKDAHFGEVTTTTYLKGSTLYVKLLDDNDTVLSGKSVHFTINGVESDVKTTSYGNAKLVLDVPKGTYTVKYTFNETGYNPISGSSKVMVITDKASKIKASAYTAYVGLKNTYTVLLTVDGLPLAKRAVDFTINGKTYHKTTNSKGKASLAIGLKKGIYTVKLKYAGEKNIKKASASAKITVKKGMPKKLTKANSVIYRHKISSPFKVKLSDARGNLLKNKKVTFVINGKKYIRTTDSKGIATLNIKLKKGTYKLKVSSAKTKIYNKVSKTYLVKIKPSQTRNNGVWLFGADMKKVNLKTLQSYGTKHIILNFKALELWGQSSVETFIKNANARGIKVHIWMQVFYKGGKWYNPVKKGKVDYDLINSKIKEAEKYAKVKGVDGVHFDYVRYPGTAYKYDLGVTAINYFVKHATAAVHKVNSKLIVSAAVMPEPSSNKYYYGQDIPTMTKYLDVIIPMVYKGNYNAGTSWIQKVTSTLVKQSSGAKVWTGLQSYKSDDDLTKLSAKSLMKDADAAAMGGAYGVLLFRYGITNFFNFNNI